MTPLSVLIVDDEPLAREGLARLVAAASGCDVVGTAASARAAVDACLTLHPDVMLLDIEMPSHSGLSVLRTLPPRDRPVVILVTAFDQYAIDAFGLDVHDYLLKPVDPKRLRVALHRAAERVDERRLVTLGRRVQSLAATGVTATDSLDRPPSLVVRDTGRIRVIPLASIDVIRAEGYYARIHCGTTSFLLRESLGSLARRLPPSFLRLHRSNIVRLACVSQLRLGRQRGFVATLSTGQEVEVSRRRVPSLRAALHRLPLRSD